MQSAKLVRRTNATVPMAHWSAGNYAVVFRFELNNGRQVALRAPLKVSAQDEEQRMLLLSAFLRRNKCRYMTDFHYVKGALRVNGRDMPVHIMDWIEGRSLGYVVRESAKSGQTSTLEHLAKSFASMMIVLRRLNIAHGDLSDGNILVDAHGNMRLIDFDTMFVPGMEVFERVTIGTPGYIHPGLLEVQRKLPHLHSYMDNFPSLVIAASLLGLRCYPQLAEHSSERLLFREDDLRSPIKSNLFSRLMLTRDSVLKDLVVELSLACRTRTEAAVEMTDIFYKMLRN